MVCKKCSKREISLKPRLCDKHFMMYIEEKVENTIKKYSMFDRKDRVLVAVSGGKDSMTLLHILNKKKYNISAMCVDEGISEYRDNTLRTVRDYCIRYGIPLKIISFKEVYGERLESLIHRGYSACFICGVFRRSILQKYSESFSVVATAHNLDDEAQTILMNLLKNNLSLLKRIGPVSGLKKRGSLKKRVKPLYFCKEKEIYIYALLNKLTTEFKECPHARESFRNKVRVFLNKAELIFPDAKHNIVDWFIDWKEKQEEVGDVRRCILCGEPASKLKCKSCELIEGLGIKCL